LPSAIQPVTFSFHFHLSSLLQGKLSWNNWDVRSAANNKP
jgi:hypothetical protein